MLRTKGLRPMRTHWMAGIALAGLAFSPLGVTAQHQHHTPAAEAVDGSWRLHWTGQVFPIVTAGEPFGRETHLTRREAYLTQPAIMANLESPSRRVVLRTTLDFEQLSQPDGEYTFGGWGEGFIDKRHPHTLLHELMLSLNAWDTEAGSFSLSAGKGFAPYGTEDPMSRPVLKYPTNHHLSQILERWTVNAAWVHRSGWGLEGAVFGGNEPKDAYDVSNIESFGNSWSGRLSRRVGTAWEGSVSYARVIEEHGAGDETTALANAALRYAGNAGTSLLYALLEASVSDPEGGDDGFWSILGEAQLSRAGHQPYARVEYATRPEYHRSGAPGTEEFFRYDHDTHADGATRWVISTLGYGYVPQGDGRISSRPFVEVQHHYVSAEHGALDPKALFGKRSFWSVSAGFRVFVGGGPMRMGTYGVLDPMSAPDMQTASTMSEAAHHQH